MIQDELYMIFWLVLLALAGHALIRACLGKGAFNWGWGVTLALMLFSAVIVAVAIDIGYVAPLAIMQDIVLAQHALRGQPLPSRKLESLVKASLEEEQAVSSMGSLWRPLAEEESKEHADVPRRIRVQAHPPFMTPRP